jgi:hypothetical protein
LFFVRLKDIFIIRKRYARKKIGEGNINKKKIGNNYKPGAADSYV